MFSLIFYFYYLFLGRAGSRKNRHLIFFLNVETITLPFGHHWRCINKCIPFPLPPPPENLINIQSIIYVHAIIKTIQKHMEFDGIDATEDEIAEFREIFNLVDLDSGGSIDLEELRELMDLLGMEASEDEMAKMVSEIDSHGSGEITFEDFVRVMSKKVTPEYTVEQVIRAFEKFKPKVRSLFLLFVFTLSGRMK